MMHAKQKVCPQGTQAAGVFNSGSKHMAQEDMLKVLFFLLQIRCHELIQLNLVALFSFAKEGERKERERAREKEKREREKKSECVRETDEGEEKWSG